MAVQAFFATGVLCQTGVDHDGNSPNISAEAPLLDQSSTEAGSRLFVGNLTMHSEASNAPPNVPEYVDDMVGEGDPSAPLVCSNNLKQIGLALHTLDAGECSLDICAQNSPPASPEPVTYTGGHFALEVDGHSSSHLSLRSNRLIFGPALQPRAEPDCAPPNPRRREGRGFFVSCPHNHLPQSSSASRFTAGAFGFLNFNQSHERPET